MPDVVLATQPPLAPPFGPRSPVGDRLADELIGLPRVVRYVAALFLVALTTGVAVAVERVAAPFNMALFFVAPVVLAAIAFGWGPSLAAVGAGVLAFDFFFTEPKYSLAISGPSDIWAAGLLLIIASIVSSVGAVARRRLEQAREEAMRAEALRALAKKVIDGRPGGELIEASAATLSQVFQAPSVVLAERGGAMRALACSGGAGINDGEAAAAREAGRRSSPIRGEIYPFATSPYDFWPITTRSGARYVLGVDFKHGAAPRPSAPERSVDIVAAFLAGLD